MSLNAIDLINTGNNFEAKFRIIQKGNGERFYSSEYNINGIATFKVQSVELCSCYCVISISIKKISKNDKKYTLTLRYSHTEKENSTKKILIDDESSLEIGDVKNGTLLNLSIQIQSWWPDTNFADLLEDEELTDFEIRGENGSVRVHKVALAAASPVMRRMLCGEWRETEEGRIEIPATRQTLQNLKNFIYCSTLPEIELDLMELLLLASRYCILSLEHKCTEKLVDLLNNKNTFMLLEFALTNKINELVLSILRALDKAKVNDLSVYYENISDKVGDQ